jgi:hypothetical protein
VTAAALPHLCRARGTCLSGQPRLHVCAHLPSCQTTDPGQPNTPDRLFQTRRVPHDVSVCYSTNPNPMLPTSSMAHRASYDWGVSSLSAVPCSVAWMAGTTPVVSIACNWPNLHQHQAMSWRVMCLCRVYSKQVALQMQSLCSDTHHSRMLLIFGSASAACGQMSIFNH